MKVLMTGGTGLLGKNIKKISSDWLYPSSDEFDVTDFESMNKYFQANNNVDCILHAAAFTSPVNVDNDPIRALEVNIVGTANIIKLAQQHSLKVVYVSTDYVFDGNVGNYSETDPINPVNKYAWSKLGGECAIRMYENSVLVRCSFGANEFEHEKAFVDQWTSRIPVDELSKKLLNVVQSDFLGVIHLGGERNSVYEYANLLPGDKKIGKISLKEMKLDLPKDTSLSLKLYNSLFG